MAIPKEVRPLGYTGKWIHFLLCAGPGFGKTVMFGSETKLLFLTTDPEGTVSAWMLGSEAREWEIKEWADLTKAYVYLRDGGIEELGIDWVVIDNISEAEEMGKQANIDLERKGKPHIDEFVPTQANYQRTQNMLVQMVKKFNDLPINVGYTAWIETREDSEGMEYFAPAIHGQKGTIAQMIAGYMNVVGYGQVVEEEDGEHRILHFAQTGPYRGKDRYNALGKARKDLTLPRMKQIIDKKVAERKAQTGQSKTPARTARPATKGTAPARRRSATTRSK
jgi:hypothetical protein